MVVGKLKRVLAVLAVPFIIYGVNMVESATEVATLGNPYRMLDTKQRKVRESNTYTAIAQLADITGTASRVYRDSRDASMERQANTDLINNTVNSDLAHHEGMYAKTVAKGQALQDFTNLKQEVLSGAADRINPEQYQKNLRDLHQKRTKAYTGTAFESITNDTHNEFWVNNEPTLIAGQSGRYRATLKNDMADELGKLAGAQALNPNSTPEDVLDVINDPDYTMLTVEDRSKIALGIAGIAGAAGNLALLEVFNEVFEFSNDPDTSKIFAGFQKKAHSIQNTLSDKSVYSVISGVDKLVTDGALTDDHYKAVSHMLDNAGNKLYTPKQFAAKVRASDKIRANMNTKDKADELATNGIDLVDATPAIFKETMQNKFIEFVKETGDTTLATEKMGVILADQSKIWSDLKQRLSLFERQPMLINNDVNPQAMQQFDELAALERGLNANKNGAQLFIQYAGKSLAQYIAIKDELALTQDTKEGAWKSVAESLALQKQTSDTKDIISALSKDARIIGPEIAEEVYGRTLNNFIPDAIEKEYAPKTKSQRISSVASIEYDRVKRAGFSDDAAIKSARIVAAAQSSEWAGDVFDTRGVPISAVLGTNDPDGAWNTVIHDPIYSSHLEKMFGIGTIEIFDLGGDEDYAVTAEGIREEDKEKLGREVIIDPRLIVKDINMDTQMLEFRSPRDGGMFYAIPLKDIGALHEAKRQESDKVSIDMLDRFYSDEHLSTETGRKWYDKQANENDYFLTNVLSPNGGNVQEYLGMPEVLKTQTRMQFHKDNYTGIMGRAEQLLDYFLLQKDVDTGSIQLLTKSEDTSVIPELKVTIYADGPGKRNNNPGNLRASSMATGSKDGFSTFESPEQGFKALVRQVELDANPEDAKRNHSIESFVKKFAPKKDGNNTAKYIKDLSKRLGVTPTTKLSTLDSTEVAKQVAILESGTTVQ